MLKTFLHYFTIAVLWLFESLAEFLLQLNVVISFVA